MIELQKSFTNSDQAQVWMGWEVDRMLEEYQKVVCEIVSIGAKYRVTVRGEGEL